jgi:dihydroxyacetone kinase
MTLTSKFKKDISMLRAAVAGEIFLDVKNPKLFKKIRKFYENNGVVFSGDVLDDYDILMEQIAVDLESVEVA